MSVINKNMEAQVAIIGAGFTGLTVAYELSKSGVNVVVLESESEIGGLASAFSVGGTRLDKFYHHWFTSDRDVMALVHELGLDNRLLTRATNTGIYYNGGFFKLSTPLDLLRFKPLGVIDRIRLGFLALRGRWVKNWKELEQITAKEWLIRLVGSRVYEVVWQPLLDGKFGCFSEKISAVWFWNKLKLRGGSRGKNGEERLVYIKGGFIELAESLTTRITKSGGQILTDASALSVAYRKGKWVTTYQGGEVMSDYVVATPAFPVIASLVSEWACPSYLAALKRIKYLGNICLVLELERALSSTYWLNVNDAKFPFVAVIEHTNFESAEAYGGKHIIYLSKYLDPADALYSKSADEFFEYAFPYLKEIFPDFNRGYVMGRHLWRSQWSQPIVERAYGELIANKDELGRGFKICSMAQIYPEDRGTNYAVREAKIMASEILDVLRGHADY